jgi:hypothetical protein
MNDQEELDLKEQQLFALEFLGEWLEMAQIAFGTWAQMGIDQKGKCFLCGEPLGADLNLLSLGGEPHGLFCNECRGKM